MQAHPAAVDGRKMEKLTRGALQIRNWRHLWGERTLLMGIVNVTPDSFSGDGILEPEKALAYALEQARLGADIVDLGAQSTRPGHQAIDVEEELRRLIPVLTLLRHRSDCLVSIDTTEPAVLSAAVAAGADMLNSIWGLTDNLLEAVKDLQIPVVLMHNKHKAEYDGDVVDEVLDALARQADRAISVGVKAEHIILDPGIGFGKTAEHNLALLHSLDRLVKLGFPTLLGTSRKSFIGKLTDKTVDSRAFGTAASVALAVAAGVDMVRVHDVEAMVDVVKVADAIVRGCRPVGWNTIS